MSALRALSIAFRELQVPELEATRKELAEVKARLEEVEDELRFQTDVARIESKINERFRRRICLLERENGRLSEEVEGQRRAILLGIKDNVELRERLSKRRKTKESSA